MPENDISRAAIEKGRRLEDIIENFLKDLKKQLRSHGIKSLYVRFPPRPGKGKTNTDFLFLTGKPKGISYYLYIEAKNYGIQPRSSEDVKEKILKKFEAIHGWGTDEPLEKNIGIVVGHFNMSDEEKKKLLQSSIHYLDTGELGYHANWDDEILYKYFLRGRLLQFMAFHTEGIFESLPSTYDLEILDVKKFMIKRSNSIVKYAIDEFSNEDYVPVDAVNSMNFFTIKIGKKGGITMISPWKGFTKNTKISLRLSKYGTTLFKTKWGKKR